MSIKIITEKCTVRGVQCRKIIRIEGVKLEADLPEKYSTNSKAIMWVARCATQLKIFNGHSYSRNMNGQYSSEIMTFCGSRFLAVGDILREDDFRDALTRIREAGKLLAEVNEELRMANENWKGEETFVI